MGKLAIMLFVAVCFLITGYSSLGWEYKSQSGEYSIEIPDCIPDFTKWEGPLMPIHIGERFRLYAMGANNPSADKLDRVVILWGSDGPKGESTIRMIGVAYVKDLKEVNGEKWFYIDKSYWEGREPSGKLERTEDPDFLEDLIGTRELANRPKREI